MQCTHLAGAPDQAQAADIQLASFPLHLPLRSRSFLEEAAVYLADEPMSDVEAMLWVMDQDGATHTAKRAALGSLRRAMYERNLQARGGGGAGRVFLAVWQAGSGLC